MFQKGSPEAKGYYFDEINQEFKLCYETCDTCNEEGDEKFHNCLTCSVNHMFRPDNKPKNNCIPICKNYYFFYHSTSGLTMPIQILTLL